MSGFTTYNSSGGGSGIIPGTTPLFSYDPLYTNSVSSQNITSGTTNTGYIPGSILYNGVAYHVIYGQQNSSTQIPFSQTYGKAVSTFSSGQNFTVEAWIYPTVAPSTLTQGPILSAGTTNPNLWYFGFDTTGSGAFGWYGNGSWIAQVTGSSVLQPKVNTWSHVAYVRNGTTGTLYVNGESAATGTDNNNYPYTTLYLSASSSDVTSNFTGYISQPRITTSALYTSNFVPNPVLGVAANTVAYFPATSSSSMVEDYSPSGLILSPVGGGGGYNSFAPPNSASNGIRFVDASSNIITANSSALTFGTGSFIVEYWINIPYNTSLSQQFTQLGNSAGFQLLDFVNYPTSAWAINSSTVNIINLGGYLASPNAWNHIAYGKSGSNITLWINGQQVGSSAYSTPVNTTWFGWNRLTVPGGNVLLGPVRISNSAVYTTGTNFSPPPVFTNTANTVFLLQGGANRSDYLTDRSVNSIPVSSFGNVVSTQFSGNYGTSGNTVGDLSGSGRNGVVLRSSAGGTVAPAVFNTNYGGYWTFPGGGVNGIIQQGGAAVSSVSNVSIMSWVQTTTPNVAITSFNNSQYPRAIPPNSINAFYINTSGRPVFYTYTTSPTTVTSTANVADGRWHHVAVSWNPGTGNISMYVDGAAAGSGTTSGSVYSMSGWYQIGFDGSGSSNGFQGNIGPIAIYQTALSASQISAQYNAQRTRFGGFAGNVANFSYTGSVQTFTVPPYVTKITARVVGAAGGAGQNNGAYYQAGGGGADISGTISVNPDSTFYIVVGRGGFANTAAGNLSQGGGGSAGYNLVASQSTQVGASSGGGFSGIFTQNPSNVTTAVNSAVLIAGGGGGGTGYPTTANVQYGGNAAVNISANASPGNSFASTSTTYQQSITAFSSTGNIITVSLNTSIVNITNYSVGEPVSFTGVTGVTSSNVYYVATANATTITATAGANGIPAAGSYSVSSGAVYPGGQTGSATTYRWQPGGGGWATPSQGGWQAQIYDGGTTAGTLTPTAGSALTGGNGGQINGNSTWAGGGGGGGGWYGGGGGAGGGGAGFTVGGGGGGGSNYANTQLVTGISYGTITQNTGTTQINGSISISW